MKSGLYIITGAFASTDTQVSGTQVTLFFADQATLDVSGGAVNLTAPTTGPDAGISVFYDRNDTGGVNLSGAHVYFGGAVYDVASDLNVGKSMLGVGGVVAVDGVNLVTSNLYEGLAFAPPTAMDGSLFTNGDPFTVAAEEPGQTVRLSYAVMEPSEADTRMPNGKLTCSATSAASSGSGQPATIQCTVADVYQTVDDYSVTFTASDPAGHTATITYQVGPGVVWLPTTPAPTNGFIDTTNQGTSFTVEAEGADGVAPVMAVPQVQGLSCGAPFPGNTYYTNATTSVSCSVPSGQNSERPRIHSLE